MKKPTQRVAVALALTGLVLALLTFEFLRFGGVFVALDYQFPADCRVIPLAGSSEDIQLDAQRGIAYLSFLDRDGIRRGGSDNGTVMLLDLNLAEPAPRAAMNHDPPGFRPHGMSLLTPAGGPARLFVISHRPDGSHVVELMEQQINGGFTPLETIRDPSFVNPNAIAAVGPRQFYLVNDRPPESRWRQMFAAYRGSGSGTLVYHDGVGDGDGGKARLMATNLAFPAGLALSPDGSRLYVGEATARALRVYRRDTGSGALTLERRIPLGTSPDNLTVDADGVVWIAAHPKLLRFLAHLRDPAERAPTQVLKYDPRRPESMPEVVLIDDGQRLSAGSVAASWRDQLLLGALLDTKVILCRTSP